jgi:hypothetical protein
MGTSVMFKIKTFLVVSILACGFSISASAETIMPQSVQSKITYLLAAQDKSDSCVIHNFSPAFFGAVSGVPGMVAVGAFSDDMENCGGNAVTTKLAIFQIDGTNYKRVRLSPEINKLPLQQVVSVVSEPNSLLIDLLYFGPNDPSCCARSKQQIVVKIVN